MPKQSLNEQAAGWAERILCGRDDLTEAEHADFSKWVNTSTQHREAFVGQTGLAGFVGVLKVQAKRQGSRWRERLVPSNVRRPRWTARAAFGIAASVIVVAIAGLVVRAWVERTHYYSTALGELREVQLADGSIAVLNTRTKIQMHTGSHGRFVELLAGEALFKVRSDPARPFIVTVQSTQIRVIGTQFNVYRRHDSQHNDVLLTVLNGAVDVSDPGGGAGLPWHRVLHRDVEVTFSRTGVTAERQGDAIQKSTGWLRRVLEVENLTLADVAAELSRYSDTPVVLADSRLQDTRIVATLDIRSIPTALSQLEAIAPIRVEHARNAYVLHYR